MTKQTISVPTGPTDYSSIGLPKGWIPPDNKSQFYKFDDAGNVTGQWGMVAPIGNVPIDVPQGTQPAPQNYADAFDPSKAQYSVNTGNATVRQLEDLQAFTSPPPESRQSNSFLVLPASILALIFLL